MKQYFKDLKVGTKFHYEDDFFSFDAIKIEPIITNLHDAFGNIACVERHNSIETTYWHSVPMADNDIVTVIE